MTENEVIMKRLDALHDMVKCQQEQIDLISKRCDLLNDALTEIVNIMIKDMSN